MKDLRIDVDRAVRRQHVQHASMLEGDYRHALSEDWKLRLGAQFTDQRAVGDAAGGQRGQEELEHPERGARVQALYTGAGPDDGFSITGVGQHDPVALGQLPGYLSLIDQDFDRANEKAVLIGAAYDFSKLVLPGLSAYFNFAWGWDAINPSTRADAPDQAEYDLTVDYRPAFKTPAFLQGMMWLRVRSAILDQQDASQLGWQVRIILNWERDLLSIRLDGAAERGVTRIR